MTIGVTSGRGPGRGLTLYGWLVLSFTLVIAACTPIFSNHGYLPTDEDLAVLQVGVDTRESVSATIGQPALPGFWATRRGIMSKVAGKPWARPSRSRLTVRS